jgi:hypothetical protein
MRAGRTVAAVVAVSLTAALAAACGAGSKPAASTTSASAPRHVHLITAASARKALLGQKDVGDPLRPHPFYPPHYPLYCAPSGAPTVAKATASTGETGVAYTSGKPSVFLNEDVYLYHSADAAHAALALVQSDMDCVTGHTYNTDGTAQVIAVGASNDYTAKLAAQVAYGWSIRTTDDYGVQFAIVAQNALLLVKYTVGLKDDPKGLPDAFDLASRANDLMSRA